VDNGHPMVYPPLHQENPLHHDAALKIARAACKISTAACTTTVCTRTGALSYERASAGAITSVLRY
jgi:hypothetical protein